MAVGTNSSEASFMCNFFTFTTNRDWVENVLRFPDVLARGHRARCRFLLPQKVFFMVRNCFVNPVFEQANRGIL